MLFSFSSCLCDLILKGLRFQRPRCATCDSLKATHKLEKKQFIKEQESLRNQLSLTTADVDNTHSELVSLQAKYQQIIQQLTHDRDDLRSQLDRMSSELDQIKRKTQQGKEPDLQQCRPLSRTQALAYSRFCI
jgi:chromosome segregation ATPase